VRGDQAKRRRRAAIARSPALAETHLRGGDLDQSALGLASEQLALEPLELMLEHRETLVEELCLASKSVPLGDYSAVFFNADYACGCLRNHAAIIH
jgi:hypothetical protein